MIPQDCDVVTEYQSHKPEYRYNRMLDVKSKQMSMLKIREIQVK